ncbi:serine/threonine protein kinase [Actinomadura rupiterrae]|uniref:serine/threonine protein kinase n=1 Tax=Actinomadura rupiterrae TaxID=559627 RepID=UPI0020A544E0|nr:serine/threonine-protein kinase [Actinomadura rupiterrae]MCP2337016.1 serine/threonine protein kinase [Actinomadura rupiterrae]
MPDAQPLRAGDPSGLGAYEVLGRLGEGGQGSVFLGRSAADRTTLVAIKLMHTGLAGDEGARARFVRELEVAKRVARFCTAQVLDADVAGDRPYIVSEYVPGMSLQRLVLEDGPRAAGALERLAIGTLTALQAIHQAGIVHRDFKPHNVMMGPDGPRVIDFGVARALGAAGETQNVGTPAYMSPEHFTGGSVGPAADMFAWGTTMAFAANGRPAFGNDDMAGVMHRILTGEPDLGTLPDPLRSIVLACLDKDPARRPGAKEAQERLVGAATGVTPVPAPQQAVWPAPMDAATVSDHSGAPGDAGNSDAQPVDNLGASGPSPYPIASGFPSAPGLQGADTPGNSLPGNSSPGMPGAGASGMPGAEVGAFAQGASGPWGHASGAGPVNSDGRTNPGAPPGGWNGAHPNGSNGSGKGRRKLAIPIAAAAAVLAIVAGGSVWAATRSGGDGGKDKTIAQGDGANGNTPTGGPGGGAANNLGGKSSSPSGKPSPKPSSNSPTKDSSPKPGSKPGPDGKSPSGQEPPNKFTAQGACDSGGHGGGFVVLRSMPVTGGTAYLLYNNATDYNCAVTMKSTGVGRNTAVSVWVQATGGGQIADSGSYQWYAGPVFVKAPKKCVRFGGNGASAPWGNCG